MIKKAVRTRNRFRRAVLICEVVAAFVGWAIARHNEQKSNKV